MSLASPTVINSSIRARLLDPTLGWDAINAGQSPVIGPIPLTFTGEDFNPPDNAPWARVTIIGANTDQVEFGVVRRFRRFGIVRVQFWLVAGTGSGQAWTLADTIRTVLEGRTLTGGVRLRGTSPPIDEQAEGAWSRWRVDTDFDGDELRLV